MSVAATSLQWLSSVPTGRLWQAQWAELCQAAHAGYNIGHRLMQQEQQQEQQEQQEQLQQQQQQQQHAPGLGDWQLCVSAYEGTPQLSAAVLEQLLSECREFPHSLDTSSSSSNNGRDDGRSFKLMRSCKDVLGTLTFTLRLWHTTAAAASVSQQDGPSPVQQLPVDFAQCCKLVQDCVRLVIAAAVAAPNRDSSLDRVTLDTLNFAAYLLSARQSQQPDSDLGCAFISGPLTAPTSAAAAMSSQLLGLLFSLLKLFQVSSSTSDAAVCILTMGGSYYQELRSSVMAALAPTLQAALDSTYSQVDMDPGSSSSSSRPFIAALPWLVLLGRWCCAAATLVRPGDGSQESDGSIADQLHQWCMTIPDLQFNLRSLQSSLAGVVQWLTAAGTIQQLTAWGYPREDLQYAAQRLSDVASALSSASSGICEISEDRSDSCACERCRHATAQQLLRGPLPMAQQQLQAASRLLTTFAIPDVCNNPACSNLCGPSEAQLTAGPCCICAGCHIARYCGRDCQRAAWPRHRLLCRSLAAAAAAAAAAARNSLESGVAACTVTGAGV